MSTPATMTPLSARKAVPIRTPRRSASNWQRSLIWVAATLLVIWGALTDTYSVDSSLAYWMGVVGGSAMLLLLLYPLRKRVERLLPMGKLRHWFAGHMVLGIAGPLLILLHCKLSLGSLNAKVAFWSMVVVAASGIAGRFLYAQLHAGLYGRQRSAAELRAEAAQALAEAAPMLPADSAAHAALDAHARLAADTARRGLAAPWQQLTLRRRARATWRACLATVLAQHGQVAPDRLLRLEQLLTRYLDASTAAARYGAAERLFSLWHVAHLPLVVILVITAAFHVLAVHMY